MLRRQGKMNTLDSIKDHNHSIAKTFFTVTQSYDVNFVHL